MKRTALAAVPTAMLVVLSGCGTADSGAPGTSASSASPTAPGPTTTPPDAEALQLPATVDDAATAARAITAAKKAWSAEPARSYVLTVHQTGAWVNYTVRTTVVDGKVADAVGLDTAGKEVPLTSDELVFTVEDLYDVVERAAAGDEFVARFDADGVPMYLDADPISEAIDDEYSVQVTYQAS